MVNFGGMIIKRAMEIGDYVFPQDLNIYPIIPQRLEEFMAVHHSEILSCKGRTARRVRRAHNPKVGSSKVFEN